jgi:hypothetical protein
VPVGQIATADKMNSYVTSYNDKIYYNNSNFNPSFTIKGEVDPFITYESTDCE